MKPTRSLWRWLAVVFVLSFAALGYLGREIYLAAPPIPTSLWEMPTWASVWRRSR